MLHVGSDLCVSEYVEAPLVWLAAFGDEFWSRNRYGGSLSNIQLQWPGNLYLPGDFVSFGVSSRAYRPGCHRKLQPVHVLKWSRAKCTTSAACCALAGALTSCTVGRPATVNHSRSSATSVPSVHAMSIVFDQDYAVSSIPRWARNSGVSSRTRTHEWFTYDKNSRIESLLTVTRNRDTGRILQFSAWPKQKGLLETFTRTGCRISFDPAPTRPIAADVIDDAIGPLRAPGKHGYREKGGKFIKIVGPSKIVLVPGSSLGSRKLLTYNRATSELSSTIFNISVGHEPAPNQPQPTCAPVRTFDASPTTSATDDEATLS